MIHLNIRFILLFVLWLAAASAATAADLEAVADRETISLNETLNFRLIYEGSQSNKDPDFSALRQQFDILSNQKSMQHSIINGNVSASTEWRLILSPKSTGQLLIPPFLFEGQRSRPLTITVTEPSRDPASGKEDVFLETFVDKSTVFVQEQFIVTFRLHYNRSVDSLDAGQLDLENTRIEALPRADYQKTIGDKTYGVAEYKYAIFADASGNIEIPAQTWTVRTTDQPSMTRFGFNGGRHKLHRVKTKPLSIAVQPRPDQYPKNAVWLPAQDVTLEEAWSQAPTTFKVGEPITRTVTLQANGAAAEQLAPIFKNGGNADFKFYPDKPNQDNRLTANGVVGTRTESVAIVPSRAGELTLPAIEVTWWNTERNQVEIATLPQRIISVEGPAVTVPSTADLPPRQQQTQQAPTSSTAPAPGSPWGWIALCAVLLLTNIATLALLMKKRSTPQRDPVNAPNADGLSDKTLFRDVQSACTKKSPHAVRSAIIAWSGKRWGQKANTLSKLGQLSGDDVLAEQLRRLDAALFAGAADSVDYALLQSRLGALRAKHDEGQATQQLKPLYATD